MTASGGKKTAGVRERELCARFFEAHTNDHPEEASTLGLWSHAGRLSDPSRAASERELARLGPVLAEAEALLARSGEGETMLDLDARLDLDAVARFARHRVRFVEGDLDASTMEIATIPNGALQHAALHATTSRDLVRIAERARATPGFLASHLENLRRGVRDGRAPDATIVGAFVARVLPGAASSCAGLAADLAERLGKEHDRELAVIDETARAAADAYRSFARSVEEEIAPYARRDVALGESETAFRLRDVMGVETTIDELLAFATRELARAHERLVDHDALMALLAKKPATIDEALSLYRRHTDDAVRLVAERDLLPLPEPLALSLRPLPGGIADGASLTNWPAPLLDPRGHGHALYSREPADHPVAQAKNLSVHEGIPGHYLQSVVWQRGKKSPVRFLGIIDDLACARAYFGTMMSVEGWAVHMEHLFREEGFYDDDGDEADFEAFVASIHAARVLCELEVHAGGMTDDEAAARFAERTHMPDRWARNQVLRSRRIPLQASTYLLGASEIERLREKAFASGVAKRDFYGALLVHGPVPTSRLTGTVFGRPPRDDRR